MRDDIRCEDPAALIGFLYEDCDADERQRIRAHVAMCAACAEELESLSVTREQLSAWTPPEVNLGFRVNPVGVVDERPAAWWARPLPAWAQLAAAAVIFAAGTGVGVAVSPRGATHADSAGTAAVAVDARYEDLNARLREMEARPEFPVTRVQLDPVSREMLLTNVKRLIQESEQRTLGQLAIRTINTEKDTAHLRQQVSTASVVGPLNISFNPIPAVKADE